MTATASVDLAREQGALVINALDDYARATLPGAATLDVGVLLDVEMNKAPLGTMWVWRTSVRVQTDGTRYFIDVSLPVSPSQVTWQLFYQAAAATPVAIGGVVTTGFGVLPNTRVRVEVQAQGIAPTTLRGRVWRPATDPTPGFTTQTDSTGPQVTGSLVTEILTPANAPTNLPITFYFDDLFASNLAAILPGMDLTGTSAIAFTFTGELAVAVALAGTVVITTTLAGTPNVLLGVFGTVPLEIDVTGQLTVVGQPPEPLAGVIPVVFGLTGQLTVPVPEPPILPPGGAIMSIADFAENALLNHLFGRTVYTAPANLWLQLTSQIPTDATNGLALLNRVQVPNNTTNWPAASGGVKTNGLAISFGSTVGQNTLVNAVGFEFWDAQTGGNRLWWGTLRVVFPTADRRAVVIPAGALQLALD